MTMIRLRLEARSSELPWGGSTLRHLAVKHARGAVLRQAVDVLLA